MMRGFDLMRTVRNVLGAQQNHHGLSKVRETTCKREKTQRADCSGLTYADERRSCLFDARRALYAQSVRGTTGKTTAKL